MIDFQVLIQKKQKTFDENFKTYKDLKEEYDKITSEKEIVYSPSEITTSHIAQLKEYNELRDIGLRLVQLIANEKNCPTKQVFEEMGQSMKDD